MQINLKSHLGEMSETLQSHLGEMSETLHFQFDSAQSELVVSLRVLAHTRVKLVFERLFFMTQVHAIVEVGSKRNVFVVWRRPKVVLVEYMGLPAFGALNLFLFLLEMMLTNGVVTSESHGVFEYFRAKRACQFGF